MAKAEKRKHSSMVQGNHLKKKKPKGISFRAEAAPDSSGFLPISEKEMKERGWEWVDFVFVIGDAYVDHASFAPAVISRVLEAHGFRVGIISQPDWKDEKSIAVFGMPRLGFLICAGNMDTMVNHYTVAKKHRKKDAYTPGAVMGKRPDRATIVYGNLIRKTYKKTPVIIGGIEASLRRLSHYDYWSDCVKRSILLDSAADLLSYGMGEHSIVEIAEALDSGIPVEEITFVKGTVYKAKDLGTVCDPVILPDFENVCADKHKFAESFYIQYQNTDPFTGHCLVEKYREKEYVIQNPPALPLTTEEMDAVYDLPYQNQCHPSYLPLGGIPALNELRFSLVSNRGCFGGCSFCALAFHQGRILQTRSHASILREAEKMTMQPDFKGNIFDVGGPTANFRHPSCEKQKTNGVCKDRQCLFPKPCPNLKADHEDYLVLLRKLRRLPKVKKVFIRSGIRFDYVVADKNDTFLKELCQYHISGQLRTAPEHVSNEVLKRMGKPEHAVYQEFLKRYAKANRLSGKEQYAIPYFMSSHPGSGLKEAVELAEYIRDLGYMPEQVQDFYPTPSTISTCMYYTGLDPGTMEPVYVPKSPHEKAMQRALIQYRNPENYDLVSEALHLAHRTDLIGFGEKCLIPPRKIKGSFGGERKTSCQNIAGKKKTIRNPHKKK